MGHGTEDIEVARLRYERDELLSISRALSAERDIRTLLDLILRSSRLITSADAGSVYILEPEDPDEAKRFRSPKTRALRFMLSQNDSMPVDFQQYSLPVDESSMVGQAVLRRTAIPIADLSVGQSGHNQTFDRRTGYQARSMLSVPLIAASGEVIGVVQLINRKREPGAKLATPADFDDQVIPFDDHAQSLAFGGARSVTARFLSGALPLLGAIAVIALTSSQLREELRPRGRAATVGLAAALLLLALSLGAFAVHRYALGQAIHHANRTAVPAPTTLEAPSKRPSTPTKAPPSPGPMAPIRRSPKGMQSH